MKISRKISLSFILSAMLLLTSCVETVVVGTIAGAVVVTREKTIRHTISDVKIDAQINSQLLKNGLKKPLSSIDVMVNEGRVLLTGILTDHKKAKEANEIAWKIKGVKEVIDEIDLVDNDENHIKKITKSFADYLITAQIETRLFFTRHIFSRNYKITTIARRVYILGVSHNRGEIARVLKVVSTTHGVKEVINHAIFVDDDRRH